MRLVSSSCLTQGKKVNVKSFLFHLTIPLVLCGLFWCPHSNSRMTLSPISLHFPRYIIWQWQELISLLKVTGELHLLDKGVQLHFQSFTACRANMREKNRKFSGPLLGYSSLFQLGCSTIASLQQIRQDKRQKANLGVWLKCDLGLWMAENVVVCGNMK